jgi:hypothetical protein
MSIHRATADSGAANHDICLLTPESSLELHTRHRSGRHGCTFGAALRTEAQLERLRLPWRASVGSRACWRQVSPLRFLYSWLQFIIAVSCEKTEACSSAVAIMHPSNFAHWSFTTARDLTLEAARDASNVRRTSTKELPSGQLKKLLDSRSERDIIDGLRRVVTVGTTPHDLGLQKRLERVGTGCD